MIYQKFTFAILLCGLSILAACKKDPEFNQGSPLTVSIGDITVLESAPSATISINVTLSEVYSSTVSVHYATLDGSALAGSDFGSSNGTVVFIAGERVKTITLPLVNDNFKEPDETFQVELSNPIGVTLGRDRATVTILDDVADLAFHIPTTGYSTPATYPGKTLVWEENFDGTYNLDGNFWIYFDGNGKHWGGNKLEYYRVENVQLSESKLIMETRKESISNAIYTSSLLSTQPSKGFKFGRIDIRAALPEGKGIWPAIWLTGTNITTVGWPACGEIDLLELRGDLPGRVYGTARYGADSTHQLQNGGFKDLAGTAKFSEEFHVFSIIWQQDKIQWLVDDVVYHEITKAGIAPANYPFNQNFFFNFKVAVGSENAWPGSPDNTTVFPQRMIVDYVRVFQ